MSTHILNPHRVRHTKRLEARKHPVQGRSRATVAAVLEAAAQVFEAYGYAAGTTNRIAECAGVSIGTLYQYFPNKEAIAVALLDRHLTEAMRRVDEWVGRAVAQPLNLHAALTIFIEGMLDLHAGQSRLQHILLEETPLPPRLHEALLSAEQEIAKRVAGLMRMYPEVRRKNLQEASVLTVQTIERLTHHFAAHPAQALPRRIFASELVAMLEAYLTSPRIVR